MLVSKKALCHAVALLSFCSSVLGAERIYESEQIQLESPSNSYWKSSVEFDNNIGLVTLEDHSIQLFERNSSMEWQSTARLTPGGGVLQPLVDMHNGTVIAVTNGVVYIYDRDDQGIWNASLELELDLPNNRGVTSVALSDDYAVLGVPFSNRFIEKNPSVEAGIVKVFKREPDNGWNAQADINASTMGAHGRFGSSVAIEGNTIVVGAELDNRVYIFTLDENEVWTQTQSLTNDTTEPVILAGGNVADVSNFGAQLAVSGDTLMVAAYTHSHDGTVLVYSKDANDIWTYQSALTTDQDSFLNFGFGKKIELNGHRAVVSNEFSIYARELLDFSDTLHVFEQETGGGWQQTATLRASTDLDGNVTSSVALDGYDVFSASALATTASLFHFTLPYLDMDEDSIEDKHDNCVSTANVDQRDHDADQFGDACDADDDNDTWPDISDAFPFDSTEQVDTDGDETGNNADTDDDNDGVPDTDDRFPLDSTESSDVDNDGIGDVGDTDDDNDGVSDTQDAFPLDPTEQADTDADGIGNNRDLDDDGDGVSDVYDALPLNSLESDDTDGDGIGDIADLDDDNDGVADTDDAYPLDSTLSVKENASDQLTALPTVAQANSTDTNSTSSEASGGSLSLIWLVLLLTCSFVRLNRYTGAFNTDECGPREGRTGAGLCL